MRFFAKIAIICNVCFLLSVVLRMVDILFQKKGKYDGALIMQPLKSTIIILGYGAIFVNLFFCIAFVISTYLTKKKNSPEIPLPSTQTSTAVMQKRLQRSVIICSIFFIVQIIYFFF